MRLENLINKALTEPTNLQDVYGDYYSPYYDLMRLLSAEIKRGVLVELGVHKGRGLASLAAGNPKNIVIGLDTVYWQSELEAIQSEYPNIIFLESPSMPVQLRTKINLLHIDTEHSYSMAKAEFEAYRPYLVKGAYVLFDDLHAIDNEVLKYFNELPYEKIQDDRLHPICGYGVLIYE